MVYSYQVIKFQTISFVNGVHWSQSVGDKGILYKSLKDPFSKLIVQSPNGSKKLYLLIPENRPGIFRAGIFAFLLGHVAYLAAFLSLGLDPAWAVITGALLCLPAVGVLRVLGPRVPSELTVAVRSYVLVISAMLLCAAGAVGGGANPNLLLGAALFYVSDLAVARDRFLAPGFSNAAWGLPLYYAAQLLLARTLA